MPTRSYHLVLYPLTTYLAELLPEASRDSSRTELFFEDLEKLPPGGWVRECHPRGNPGTCWGSLFE